MVIYWATLLKALISLRPPLHMPKSPQKKDHSRKLEGLFWIYSRHITFHFFSLFYLVDSLYYLVDSFIFIKHIHQAVLPSSTFHSSNIRERCLQTAPAHQAVRVLEGEGYACPTRSSPEQAVYATAPVPGARYKPLAKTPFPHD